MQEFQKILMDPDLIYCPITRQIMRHPVIVGGRHYELAAINELLIKQQFKSPLTGKKIESVDYDYPLKSTLDANFNEAKERHQDYDKSVMLEQIKNYLERGVQPGVASQMASCYFLKQSMLANFLPTVIITLCSLTASALQEKILHLAAEKELTEIPCTLSLQEMVGNPKTMHVLAFCTAYSLLLVAVDYSIRSESNNRRGLYGVVGRFFKGMDKIFSDKPEKLFNSAQIN